MKKVWSLAWAFLREHPTRVALTSLATVAATCLVLWVAAGYDSLLKTFDVWANRALGRYELSIGPIAMQGLREIPSEVLDAIRADPVVTSVEPMWLQQASVRKRPVTSAMSHRGQDTSPAVSDSRSGRNGPSGRHSEFMVLASESPLPPFDLTGEWLNFTENSDPESSPGEAVLSKQAAKRLQVSLQDEILISDGGRTFPLRVVGLLEIPSLGTDTYAVPQILIPGRGDIFVSRATAERLFETPAKVSFLALSMKPGTDVNTFRFGWAPRLSQFEPPVQFQEAHEIEESLDETATAENMRLQAYATTGIAMLLAMLLIFCTVSMGVTERIRQFAILRAVGLTRFQVGLLVFSECLLLAVIGFIGGIVVGGGLLKLMALASSGLLHHGAILGPRSFGLAAIATFGSALLAAMIPAWRASRVRPVDAMSSHVETFTSKATATPFLIGLLLIAVNPLLTFGISHRFEQQLLPVVAIGLTTMSLGFVLISPGVVALIDRYCSPWLASMSKIDPKLLASQITTHIWRTTAAAISLSVGLGLLITVQVWGFTMLEAFIVGPWAPDAVLVFQSGVLPWDQAAKISQISGIDSNHALPIVVEQPRLWQDVTGSGERASVVRQDNVVIVGIDPQQAFGGTHPLMKLDWAEGSPEGAIDMMREGRGCLVPDHFLVETGFKIGDEFELVPPENPTARVRYTIAGAVRLPGWHWQTKLTGFRSRTHRAAALVFANLTSVSEDFGITGATHLWFDYSSSRADPEQITASASEIYTHALMTDDLATSALVEEPKLRLMAVEDIRQMTRNNAKRWIWGASLLPLVATLIAALGVLNVMLASVRSRCWEIGVLRSIGVSQSAIVRAILVEGLMIGMVASVLSIGFGLLCGWCGCGIAQYLSFFGGLHPDLVIPWFAIGFGVGMVLLLTVLAAVWPAMLIGRLQPLTLLQRGRLTF